MFRTLRHFAGLSALATLAVSASAHAQLGNLTYQAAEMGKPLVPFTEATFTGAPGGSNTVLMLRKYMLVMGSHDSGVPDGPMHVFDVKDPRQPKLLKRFTSQETSQLRELHAMPVAMIDGKDVLVFPTIKGLQFFDYTDPLNPKALGNLSLDGVNAGDYDNAAWMVSWVWPYVYVGGTGNGVYIVDAHDPMNPTLASRMETPKTGGFRIGPVYGAGNYIIVSGMDASPTKVSVLDAGDPQNPVLLASGSGPASMYSTVVIGDRIYGSGEGGEYSFMKWSATAVETIGDKIKMGNDKGGYCTYQDAFIFCGQSSEGFRKIDVSDEQNIHEVAHADLADGGADTDFATVLGNLVYLGNDHGSGAAFFPHDLLPDTKPPKLLKVYPENGDLQQPLGSRMTLFFSDEIDIDSITSESIIVRPVGGQPLAGVFSHSSFNAVSFGAKEPLLPDTTYEILVVKGGLKDLAQNPIAEDGAVRFSTGATIEEPIGGGGTSAAGGASGGAGGASGGASVGGTPAGGSAAAGGPPRNSGGVPASGGQPGAGTTSTDPGAGSSSTPAQPSGGAADSGSCNLPHRSPSGVGFLGLALAALAAGARRGRSREGLSRS